MNRRFLQMFTRLVIISGVCITGASAARAVDAPELSGSYELLQHQDAGTQTHVRILIQVANHGAHEVNIQRLTLWDLKHADPGATQATLLVVHPGANGSTEQEFTIPRTEYELWTRGTRPRLVLEVGTSNNRKATEVIRLERISRGRAN
jgi:hypothetical protein